MAFSFQTWAPVPEQGGRKNAIGGLVEVDDRIVWEGGRGGVYCMDAPANSKWEKMADGEMGATLAASRGRLVCVGGLKGDGSYSKTVVVWSEGRWVAMADMLVGTRGCCVISVGEGGLVVMGGYDDRMRRLNDVQVFDGNTQTWHYGPPLPQPCYSMSAIVHGDTVFVMGGRGMKKAVWCASITDLTSTNTRDKQSTSWKELPDVPYCCSSASVIDNSLIAIGGSEDRTGSKKISAIYAFHHGNQKWQHVGDLPFECSDVDVVVFSGRSLLAVDGHSQQVLKITAKGLANPFAIPTR